MPRRLRPLQHLVHDAVDATVGLVREGQDATGRAVVRAAAWVPALEAPARLAEDVRRASAGVALGSVSVANRIVEAVSAGAWDAALDAGLLEGDRPEAPVPLRSDVLGTPDWTVDAALGMLNGVFGDHLARRGNGLDLGCVLRVGDRYLDDADASTLDVADRRLVVLVHGLSTTEWSWCLDAETFLGAPDATFGSLLHRDQGLHPVYVRYNSGRPVATNARALARALDRLVATWPVPVEELVLVGHSMGGLVVRAACVHARSEAQPWLDRTRRVVSLGTPHQGAPLARFTERAARTLARVDLPFPRVVARLLDARSAGIRDLEHARVEGEEPALVDGLTYAFVAGTITTDPEHPVGRFVGDLLVRAPSARGPRGAGDGTRHATFGGVLHHELQTHPEVYATVRELCR